MARVFIKTFGCSLNNADSESMAGVLERGSHSLVGEESGADVVVVNSCIVKGHSQAQLFTYIKKAEGMGKKVVVAGCGAQGLPDRLGGYPLVGTHQVHRVGEAVDAALEGVSIVAIDKVKGSGVPLPKVRRNPVVDIVPINKGCLGACTFCIVKKTRGSLESYDPRSIVEAVESAVRDGVKEIWLTSPDTAVYGVDLKFPITRLLERVCEVDGDFQVRLGMGNPNWFIRYLDDLPGIFLHPRMFRFLHVPVQSGSDRILESMKRGYASDDYLEIVDRMRSEVPDLTISTDVIVGFPGESEEDFRETERIIERTAPDVLNLSRFTARPGTPAESMPGQVKGDARKDRSTRLAILQEKIASARNARWLGWRGRVLIDEQGAHGCMIGRNLSYKPVAVEGSFPIGSFVDVEVTSVHSRFLKARRVGGMQEKMFHILR